MRLASIGPIFPLTLTTRQILRERSRWALCQPTAEWEELENQDTQDINLAEVWSMGIGQQRAAPRVLASNRPKDLEPSVMEDGICGRVCFEPVEVDATVLNVGQIHPRCDYGTSTSIPS